MAWPSDPSAIGDAPNVLIGLSQGGQALAVAPLLYTHCPDSVFREHQAFAVMQQLQIATARLNLQCLASWQTLSWSIMLIT
jgi:hypothetical protein